MIVLLPVHRSKKVTSQSDTNAEALKFTRSEVTKTIWGHLDGSYLITDVRCV